MDDDSRDLAHWAAAEEGAELVSEGEYEAAIAELSRVVQDDAHNPYALFFLGAALYETEEPARALKAYLEALRLKPDYVGAMIGVGWSLYGLGRYREAIKMAKQLLLKRKDDPDALYLLGLCHYSQGDTAASLGYLQRFLNTRPEVEVALEVEGLIKVLRGEVLSDDDDDDDDD